MQGEGAVFCIFRVHPHGAAVGSVVKLRGSQVTFQ